MFSQTLKSWDALRNAKLQEQLKLLQIQKKERKIAHRAKTIEDIDEKLWFFDNEEIVDLKIQNKKETLENETTPTYKKKTIKEDDVNYIPPEVSRR